MFLHFDTGGFADYGSVEGSQRTSSIIRIYEHMDLEIVNVACIDIPEDETVFKKIFMGGGN